MPEPVPIQLFDFPGFSPDIQSRADYVEEHADEIVSLFLEQIEDANIKVLSFDVFDTLLLRNEKSEARRYQEMCAKIAAALAKDASGDAGKRAPDADDVLAARTFMIQMTYRTAPLFGQFGEGKIDEVYRGMADMLGLPEETIEIMRKAEIDYELENLSTNRPFFEAARQAAGRGVKIICISDMYLPGEMITAFIEGAAGEDARLIEKLYSSSDHGHSKRSGTLYGEVVEDLRVEPGEILHIGDNVKSDVIAARAAGCRALHFPISRAESARRHVDLNTFVRTMEEGGLSVRHWAQL